MAMLIISISLAFSQLISCCCPLDTHQQQQTLAGN